MQVCKLQLINIDEQPFMPRKLLPYFVTLQNMVSDVSVEMNNEIVIPIPDFITRAVIAWCIEACLYHRAYKKYKPVETDIPFLLSVCEALNWLESKDLLTHCVDNLYRLARKTSTAELEALSGLKITLHDRGGTFTPYYRREKLISDYLSKNLIQELVKPMYDVLQYSTMGAVGESHSFFISDDGLLFGHGNNHFGQLGVRRCTKINRTAKQQIPIDGKPISIACGTHHTLCLTTTGLYVCGSNLHGELCIDDLDTAYSEKWLKLDVEGEVLIMSAGECFTAILTTDGLFTCGRSTFGELGLEDVSMTRVLSRVNFTEPIIELKCKDNHMIVWTNDARYGCGRNDRILFPDRSAITTIPRLTKLDK